MLSFLSRRSMSIDKRTLKQLTKIHLKILDSSALINRTLSPVMIYSFALSFLMLCIFIFSMFIFPKEFWIQFTCFAIANAMMNVHYIILMIGVVWACESTVGEEKNCGKLLFRILMHDDADTANDIQLFIHQLATNKMKFSCALFDFNWNLLFRVSSIFYV